MTTVELLAILTIAVKLAKIKMCGFFFVFFFTSFTAVVLYTR